MAGLNERALRKFDAWLASVDRQTVAIHETAGARVVDCGVEVAGGVGVGLLLAEVCLAGWGTVSLQVGDDGPQVAVHTDRPLAACMQSQYAGWRLSVGEYFAMGSGPMRAAAGGESIYDEIGGREDVEQVIGVLETSQLPSTEVVEHIAAACRVAPSRVTLLAARTASVAGSLQVVARSVETALHKLHEIGFDLHRVVAGWGTAPLAPVAKDDLAGIGRTNDAVLYGGDVLLWVTGDDASLEETGPATPSNASRDFGRPFGEVFAGYNYDFYQVDPHLFSPAIVRFENIETGTRLSFGERRPDILAASFGN